MRYHVTVDGKLGGFIIWDSTTELLIDIGLTYNPVKLDQFCAYLNKDYEIYCEEINKYIE